FLSATRPPPRSTLFPYTTLFRSWALIDPPFSQRRRSHGSGATSTAAPLAQRTHNCPVLAHVGLPSSPNATKRPRQNAPGLFIIQDRKSTRLNSSHVKISYAVFCL